MRCGERGFLEFDNVEPVALGGESTTTNGRLTCAAHNRYEARRRLGDAAIPRKEADFDADALLALRTLGVKPADARYALAGSADIPAPTLEERLRAALRVLNTVYTRRCSEPCPVWESSMQHVGGAQDGGEARPRRRPRSFLWTAATSACGDHERYGAHLPTTTPGPWAAAPVRC